ncbi:Phospholipase/Carboxylesterase-domain-containing protein [Aspergillus cavernicola]|uniref:Phospholipase/Carboxylesterase-domain-containing protein n=1 Tax=Aspergillus cavernicola TaxID=176166 RepID=A0ABR4J1G0_9EURO
MTRSPKIAAAMPQTWSAPFVIAPKTEHTHTIILLHDVGNKGARFGKKFLRSSELHKLLPTVKFVFPSAKDSHATLTKRGVTMQWFDSAVSVQASADIPPDSEFQPKFQIEGLRESSAFLRTLVDEEALVLKDTGKRTKNGGYDRVVIGGLGQGAAAAIFCLLGSDHRLGGFIGLDGWLPFHQDLTIPAGMQGERALMFRLDALDTVRYILNLEPLDPSSAVWSADVNDFVLGLKREAADMRNFELALTWAPCLSPLRTPVFSGRGKVDQRVFVDFPWTLERTFAMDVTPVENDDIDDWCRLTDEYEYLLDFMEWDVLIPCRIPHNV